MEYQYVLCQKGDALPDLDPDRPWPSECVPVNRAEPRKGLGCSFDPLRVCQALRRRLGAKSWRERGFVFGGWEEPEYAAERKDSLRLSLSLFQASVSFLFSTIVSVLLAGSFVCFRTLLLWSFTVSRCGTTGT